MSGGNQIDWHALGIDVRGRTSGNVKTRCPKCAPFKSRPNAPDLSVDLDQGVWNCHYAKCGWSGPNGGDGVLAYGTRLTAVERQPKSYVRPKPVPDRETADEKMTRRMLRLLDERKIDHAVAARAGVTWGMAYMPQFEQNPQPAMQFPYYVDGVLVNVKYRGPLQPDPNDPAKRSKTFRTEKDAELVFWNRDIALAALTGMLERGETPWLIVTEGEFDALACMTAGLDNVVSVPGGAVKAGMEAKLEYMASGADLFDMAEVVVIATDGDDPGQWLGKEIARRVGIQKCYGLTWPDGTKDANDVLMQRDGPALKAVIEAAQAYPIEGILRPGDLIAEVEAWIAGGPVKGLDPGWPNLARLYRPDVGELSVWVGVPSHGKSSFISNLAVNMAEQHGWHTVLFSPETFPPQRLVAYLARIKERTPLWPVGVRMAMTADQRARAIAWVNRYFSIVRPHENTLAGILELMRVLVYRDGAKQLIIDPWTELANQCPPGVSETKYIGMVLSEIRDFCQAFGVHAHTMVHPTKLPRFEGDDGQIETAVPDLYAASGSANFANKTDWGGSVWRKKTAPDQPVEVTIEKVRYAESGQEGVAYFTYDRATGVYTASDKKGQPYVDPGKQSG